MDLAPPGRAAAAATFGVAARAPLTLFATPTRARPAAAAATAVADFFFRLANPGSGWSRGWTSGGRGERPRPMGSPRDRRAVAHSGWGSQACSLSVDVVQRQRHAAIFFFANGDRRRRRWSARMDLAPPGRAAAAATFGVAARAPLTLFATPTRARPAAAAATAVADFFFRLANPGSGWSRGWTSGGRGERPRPMGSPRDRRAVAHSGWGSQACSLSVDVVQRQRHAAIFFFANGDRRRRRWSARMDLAPPGRAAAAATFGVAARAPLTLFATPTRARPAAAAATAVADFFFRLANPGSGWSRGWTSGGRGERPRPMGSPRDRRAVAHSGWGSQACSLSVDVVQRQRHAAIFFFANGDRRRRRWSARMDLAPPGRAAAAATFGVAARAPLTLFATPTRARPAAAAATAVADFFFRLANPGSGWSRGWTSGGRGERPRPMGSPRDRRAVAHSGWGSQACSLSVDVVQRQRHAAIFFFANGDRRRRRWSARMDLAPPGRAAAAATFGVAARAPLTLFATPTRARPAAAAATAVADFFFRLANPGSGWSRGWTSGGRGERPRPMGSPRDRRAVAHSGWGSQACSLSVDVVQRQRHAAIGGKQGDC